jgi:hypothetical protein
MSEPTTRTTSRINIAYTESATAAARRLVDRFHFPGLVDVARAGLAYALRSGYALERPDGFGATSGSNFNVGTVDPRGELRDLLLALHPEIEEDPYRVIETLMSLGTIALDEQVTAGEVLSLKDMVSPPAE